MRGDCAKQSSEVPHESPVLCAVRVASLPMRNARVGQPALFPFPPVIAARWLLPWGFAAQASGSAAVRAAGPPALSLLLAAAAKTTPPKSLQSRRQSRTREQNRPGNVRLTAEASSHLQDQRSYRHAQRKRHLLGDTGKAGCPAHSRLLDIGVGKRVDGRDFERAGSRHQQHGDYRKMRRGCREEAIRGHVPRL